LIKVTIYQIDLTIVNIYTVDVSAPNFIKETVVDVQAQTPAQLQQMTLILHSHQKLSHPDKKSTRKLQNQLTLQIKWM
jgi:hypothetical protein